MTKLEGYISNLDELLDNPAMYNTPVEPSLKIKNNPELYQKFIELNNRVLIT